MEGKMPDWVLDVVKVAFGGVLVLVGHLLSWLRLKWKTREARKDRLIEERKPIYDKGLEFIYEVEQNQIRPEELDRIYERWRKWYPLNSRPLPPSINDALFSTMSCIPLISTDLHNRQTNRETWREFREKLQATKMMLTESKDIGWLQQDLK